MSRFTVIVAGAALSTGILVGCGSNSSEPLAPSTTTSTSATSKAADGSTLKTSAPVPQSPVGDQRLTAPPVLTASPATANFGSTPPLSYRFEVYSPANVMVDSGAVNFPSFQVTAALQGNARHTWRVRAELLGNAGPWSAMASFISPVPFDMSQAVMLDNPPDVASWAETSTITLADTSDFIIVDHSKRTGPGRWPESGFGTGGIQYTLGMCFNLSGRWFCSAAIQFWEGRDLEAGGPASNVGINWYYDARWGPMAGHQPAQGEVVGIFVAQGNLRDTGNTSVKERSNVVLVPFGSVFTSSASSAGARRLLQAPH